MDIYVINDYLREGKSVKEIRELLGYSEKNFQKTIKNLGYKYDQKQKQYILKDIDIIPIEASNTVCTTSCITPNLMTIEQEQSINFIHENIQDLQEMLMYYKRNKECNTSHKGIVINLIDDKDIDNGRPVSVRVNKHVWREWQDFTKDISYSSKDLVSMALKEYLEKYK